MIKACIQSPKFQNCIIAVIVFNAVILGIDTIDMAPRFKQILHMLDAACLVIYVTEIILKLSVYKLYFFKNGWNIFDFIIVALCLVPNIENLAILRVFRVLRVLRLLSMFPRMRLVANALLNSIAPMFSIGFLLFIFFYVYGILCFNLFGERFPEFFGSLGGSLYSLFQIMTLESWSMGIARPVIAVFPYAWIVFVSFILIVSFIVLNLAIGIIVNSISELSKENPEENELNGIKNEINELKNSIKNLNLKG